MKEKPKILDEIANKLKSNIEVQNIVKAGYKFTITVDKKEVKIRQFKILSKKKKPVFSSEEMAGINFLRTTIKDRTGILYISGLLQQLLQEIRKHHLIKYNESTQQSLGILYNKTIDTLGKEVKNAGQIDGKGRGVVELT